MSFSLPPRGVLKFGFLNHHMCQLLDAKRKKITVIIRTEPGRIFSKAPSIKRTLVPKWKLPALRGVIRLQTAFLREIPPYQQSWNRRDVQHFRDKLSSSWGGMWAREPSSAAPAVFEQHSRTQGPPQSVVRTTAPHAFCTVNTISAHFKGHQAASP